MPPDPETNYIVPKGQKLEVPQKQKSRVSSKITLPPDYRKTLQSFKPAVSKGKISSQEARAQNSFESVEKKVQTLDAFRKYKTRPETPDAIFQFGRSIKNLTEKLSKQQSLPSSHVFREHLAAISIDTNAFIAVSETNDAACNIWGEPNEVDRARNGLQTFEMITIEPGKGQKSNQKWAKEYAYDGRIVHREILTAWTNYLNNHFREDTDDTMMPYQAHLYWPDGYDLEKYLDYYSGNVLRDLMDKYQCIIKLKPTERIIKIGAQAQQALFHVYNRLMGLAREMVARQKPGLYATHCEVPGVNAYRDQVKLINSVTSTGRIIIPILTGKVLPKTEHENWTQLSTEINKKYRRATKNALRSCISSLHASQKHLQLRVIFGNFGLAQVMRADDGQDTYHIDEFLHKIQKPGTKVLQRPLEEGQSFYFINNIESYPEFQKLELSWEVCFEFSGGPNKKLELVKEYVENIVDRGEPSVAATRWLSYDDASVDDHSEILSVNRIDMQKCGYNLYLGGGTIFQNQTTSEANAAFERTVKFRPSMDGLRHQSNKRVIHAHSNAGLTTVRETTVVKYSFKETRGTFEIRRTDIFNAKPGELSPVAIRTEWSANYYYAGWDSLLSDFGNIEPGEDIEWQRDLKTFFPKVADEDNPQALPTSFKDFMKEVNELQILITKAISDNQDSNHKPINGTTTSGTKQPIQNIC